MRRRDNDYYQDVQVLVDESFKVPRAQLAIALIWQRGSAPKKERLPQEALDIVDAVLNFRYWEDASAL